MLELLSPPVSQQLLSPLMSPHDVIISSPSQISSLSGELLVNSPVQLSSSHSKEDQISTIASQHQHHHHHHSSSVNKDQMMQSQCQSQSLMSPLLSPQVTSPQDHRTTQDHIALIKNISGLSAPVSQPGQGPPGPAEPHGVAAAGPGGRLPHPQPAGGLGGDHHGQVGGGRGRPQQLQPGLLVSGL